MASRYPPPRDRSPARHFDRRPSATYTPGASSYRGGESQPSSLDRAPPRGPKADFRGGGSYQFSPAPRGRGGFPSRGSDIWDRDRDRDRDARVQPPPYRREDDRGEWARRDRDFPPVDRASSFTRDRPYTGRERSASPERPRRNSKENIPSTFNRPAESASTYYTPAARGGSIRDRGRGDLHRSRGRPSFAGDRDYFPRSRSREDWRDRYDERSRLPGPDSERADRFDRREYDRTDDRDARLRDHDVWPRDRSPGRNSTGRPASPSAVSTVSQHGERYKTEYEAGRKPSLAGPLSARSESRRETEPDYFSSRTETPRRDGPLSQQFPTPSVPQSSALGLDYGPPPSAPATTPSLQEKTAPVKPQVAKTEPPAGPAVLQPPSGPKADRVGPPSNAPSTPRAATQQFEPWPKADTSVRAPRTGPALNTAPPPSEPNWKQSDSNIDARATAPSVAVDRPLPANVPSGPRNPSASFRARLLSNEQAASNAPPTAPRQPKASAVENRAIPNAPTGPRSSTFPGPGVPHNSPPTGPQTGANRQWVAPDYRPAKPSIMNQMNKPYQPDVRERSSFSGPSLRPGGVTYQSQQAKPKITQPLSADSASQILSARALGTSTDTPSGTQTPLDEEIVDSPADVEMSLPASDEEDVEDDDGLDEDYFAASEETHVREMKLLEARKPPPPLLDPTTAALIIRVQLLDMIANEVVPEAYEEIKNSADSAMDTDAAPSNAPPSPEHTPEEGSRLTLDQPRPRGRPLSQPQVNPIPTPPIDELPYLNDAMEECHVFGETDSDSDPENTMLLCKAFSHQTWDDDNELENLHDSYMSRYPQWRREVEHAEQRLREVHQPSPAPASPAPSATPSLPPGPDRPGEQRTRGARNTTDLDMQQAILMSQQSAKEEEERREREAASNALPNYETEAVVPDMWKPSDADLYLFEDTNNLVNHDFALDIYEFVPPEDDFTDEEQAAFITSYCQTPKKWGKIADAVGRSYQECITHYYLTKDKANYKEHWRRSQPKRGRRRAANIKPRANNLMSDLALNEDGEGTTAPVTDSGRPRRAAAPTFGDALEVDPTTAAPQAKRLKESAKDDSSQPKQRGRKGTGTGKGRKTKGAQVENTLLLPAGGMDVSPQKVDRAILGNNKSVRTSMKADNLVAKPEQYSVPSLAVLQKPLEVPRPGPVDVVTNNTGPVPVQVTSYWSVPEQTKFPFLVRYYGRDYAAIASFLKTKSAIMIKNYWTREVGHGKQHLEQWADAADEKRAKGEPMGPPPTPVQPPKRRYEATPSMAAMPRTSTVMNDQHMSDVESMAPATKAIIEEFPSNSIQRVAGELVAKPRQPKETVHHSPISLHVHPKIEESTRNERQSILQKPQGPPRGLFPDESMAYSQQHQKLQMSMQEPSPHQRPMSVVDHRAIDSRSQQPIPNTEMRGTDYSRALLSHGRDQLGQQQTQAQALSQYQPLSDRSLQHTRLVSHSRHPSLVTSHTPQSSHEQAAEDLASLRNMGLARNIGYSTPSAHSPITAPVQTTVAPKHEYYPTTRPSMLPAEPPKPPQGKRSNVFGLLNDDPPDPPVKRSSTDSVQRNNINTPPPQAAATQSSIMPSRLQEDNMRTTQPSYSHLGRIDPTRQDFRGDYSSSPAPGHTETWLDRNDPRRAVHTTERATQQSPAPGNYSVVPPSTQPSPAANIHGRYDPTRNMEPSNHRRSLLGIEHIPSPPPQQQQQQPQQPSHLHRSSSGSSQHGRTASANYQQTVVSGAPSYSHSAVSTPVSSAHHRNQHSMDQPRQTIQQLMRERGQAPHTQQRDPEIMQHSHQHQQSTQPQIPQHPPSQPPSRMSDRRDNYVSAPESRSAQHHMSQQQAQGPQQSLGMNYSTAPPNRTYTPPGPSFSVGGHPHSHHAHQQYQTHQSQYTNAPPQGQGPGQHQHHQSYQSHPGYGLPPHNMPPNVHQHQRNVHSLGPSHQTQQQQQQQGHYRGYSTDERR